jgi:hypothetical protein
MTNGYRIARSGSAASQRPETLGQARTWDSNANAWEDFGLCRACAGQAAWGAQLGFAEVHPPCPDCAPKIAHLPTLKPNEWRMPEGGVAALRAARARKKNAA